MTDECKIDTDTASSHFSDVPGTGRQGNISTHKAEVVDERLFKPMNTDECKHQPPRLDSSETAQESKQPDSPKPKQEQMQTQESKQPPQPESLKIKQEDADIRQQADCVACRLVLLEPSLGSHPRLGSYFKGCEGCTRAFCTQHVESMVLSMPLSTTTTTSTADSPKCLCVLCRPRCVVCASVDVDGGRLICQACTKPVCHWHSSSCFVCESTVCRHHHVYCIDCELHRGDYGRMCWSCHEGEQISVCRACYNRYTELEIRHLFWEKERAQEDKQSETEEDADG